jgi:hypothetical protein
MPSTYEPIATTTLSSATNTVNFTSIPSTYTDLVLVCNIKGTGTGTAINLQFNSDTGSNYSTTFLAGISSSPATAKTTNAANISTAYATANYNGVWGQMVMQIQNYKNTTTFKSVLIRSGQGNGETVANIGLWRNTNAITTINLPSVDNYDIGSTFTLYGILKA